MIHTPLDVVTRLAPHAAPAYRIAFGEGDRAMADAGITTRARLAHFMTQCLHETAGLTLLVERGTYTAETLAKLWDGGNWHRYFDSRDACLAAADDCRRDEGRALFCRVYGGRMGNAPLPSDDGWRYRGRGLLQTTGRSAYRRHGALCGVNFEADPDLIVDPAHLLKPALAVWTGRGLNRAADADDLKSITRAINGGLVGLDERRQWLRKVAAFLATPLGGPARNP